MLEIEENEAYPTIDSLKEKLIDSGLKYDNRDYFVKKSSVGF